MRTQSSTLIRFAAGILASTITLVAGTEHALGGRLAGNNGIHQTGIVDHTANRLDSEVFGWSNDFTQVAAVVAHTRRGRLGGARGEVLLVVWPTNNIKPLENVEINIITAADLPNAPAMLMEVFDDGKSQLGDIDYNLARLWPKRPKKTRPDGWMKVDVLWDPAMVSNTDCQPAVAFMLEKGDEVRFQPHQVASDIRANCQYLKLTNTRTYWGRPDLAVTMARFDWAPDDHEISFRQPVSANWEKARELRILVRTGDRKDERTKRVMRSLARYGRVRVERSEEASVSTVAAADDLKFLEQRLAKELSLARNPTVLGVADVVVTLGNDDPGRPVPRYGSTSGPRP